MTFATWLGFLAATLVVSITPGPGFMLSTGTALRSGFRAALKGILGLQLALLGHIALVAVGLGVLLASSPTAYLLLRLLGAAYLVWLGWLSWRDTSTPTEAPPPALAAGPFWQGVLVNLTNPKAILFIAALLPQFVDPAGELLPQYALIAATTCLVDFVVMCGYASLASRLRTRLTSPAALSFQRHLFGAVFMVAGIGLAFSGRAA